MSDPLALGYNGTSYEIWGCSNIVWFEFLFWWLKLCNESILHQVTKNMFTIVCVDLCSLFMLCLGYLRFKYVFSFIFASVLCRVFVSFIFRTNSLCYLWDHNLSFILFVFSILLILVSLFIYLDCIMIAIDFSSLIFNYERTVKMWAER